jgi:hypothetical protein
MFASSYTVLQGKYCTVPLRHLSPHPSGVCRSWRRPAAPAWRWDQICCRGLSGKAGGWGSGLSPAPLVTDPVTRCPTTPSNAYPPVSPAKRTPRDNTVVALLLYKNIHVVGCEFSFTQGNVPDVVRRYFRIEQTPPQDLSHLHKFMELRETEKVCTSFACHSSNTHRHVRPGAHKRVGHGVDQLTADAEVTQLYLTTRIDKNIRRLHICTQRV